MSHKKVLCRNCKNVVSNCRCMAPDKIVEYVDTCKACQPYVMRPRPADPPTKPPADPIAPTKLRAALDEVYLHEDPIVPTKLRAALNEVYRLRKVLAAADHVIYTANMCRGFCDGCHSGCDVCDALKEYERVKKT